MGTYNAFLDLTPGSGSPALRWLGGAAGLGSIFIGSAVAALLAVPIALRLLYKPGSGKRSEWVVAAAYRRGTGPAVTQSGPAHR